MFQYSIYITVRFITSKTVMIIVITISIALWYRTPRYYFQPRLSPDARVCTTETEGLSRDLHDIFPTIVIVPSLSRKSSLNNNIRGCDIKMVLWYYVGLVSTTNVRTTRTLLISRKDRAQCVIIWNAKPNLHISQINMAYHHEEVLSKIHHNRRDLQYFSLLAVVQFGEAATNLRNGLLLRCYNIWHVTWPYEEVDIPTAQDGNWTWLLTFGCEGPVVRWRPSCPPWEFFGRAQVCTYVLLHAIHTTRIFTVDYTQRLRFNICIDGTIRGSGVNHHPTMSPGILCHKTFGPVNDGFPIKTRRRVPPWSTDEVVD